MPRDYDLGMKAVSGFRTLPGGGKIAGSPEGTQHSNELTWRFKDAGNGPGSGVLRGSPVGISGEIRRMTSDGMMDAIAKRLG